MHTLASITQVLNHFVWGVDLRGMSPWRVGLTRALRLVYAVLRDLAQGQLSLQAMSLVYTTLLSLVPLLAVSFSVLKGFGVHNQIEPLLLNVLEPLGEKGVEITAIVIGFVENVKVGVLGSLGLGLLIYTVIALIQKIERVFNHTWRVERPRPFAQRFSDYLSVILIGPVLVFSALGTTASFMSNTLVQKLVAIQPLGLVVESFAKLIPYLFIIGAFTFVYVFVPNTRVRIRSALLGALVAGVLWQTIGWGFAAFVVSSTKYAAIYSGFAIVVVFMIWLYLAWLILLVGANIAFYHQHPEQLATRRRELQLSIRLKERLSLQAMVLIGRRHYEGGVPWTAAQIAKRLEVPAASVRQVLGGLSEAHLVLTTTIDEVTSYLPGRALETTKIKDLLDVVRASGEDRYLNPTRIPVAAGVESLISEIDAASATALQGRTLRDLVVEEKDEIVPGGKGSSIRVDKNEAGPGRT